MMQHAVWKYPLGTTDVQAVGMPRGARPLCVQVQNGSPCLWALVPVSAERCTRTVRIVGTGHPCDDCAEDEYVGTYQLHGGELVFHVFIGAESDDT